MAENCLIFFISEVVIGVKLYLSNQSKFQSPALGKTQLNSRPLGRKGCIKAQGCYCAWGDEILRAQIDICISFGCIFCTILWYSFDLFMLILFYWFSTQGYQLMLFLEGQKLSNRIFGVTKPAYEFKNQQF